MVEEADLQQLREKFGQFAQKRLDPAYGARAGQKTFTKTEVRNGLVQVASAQARRRLQA